MNLAALIGWALVIAGSSSPSASVIRSVSLRGNLRMRPEAVVHQMSSAPGTIFDSARVSDDIRRLHGLGVFSSIEISSVPVSEGQVDLLVDVRERPFVSFFSIEGVNETQESRIRMLLKDRELEFRPAAPYDPARAALVVRTVRSFLADHGYPMADVRILMEDKGSVAGIRVDVRAGRKLKVGKITFSGNKAISTEELISQMHHTPPARWWELWSATGRYTSETLTADLGRVRQYYRSQGYADVKLGTPSVVATKSSPPWWPLSRFAGNRPKLTVNIPLSEGHRYTLRSVEVEGDAGAAAGPIRSIAGGLRSAGRYDSSILQTARQKMLDALGCGGYASGRVELNESIDPLEQAVHAGFKVDAGRPFVIGRIDFFGNERLPDRLMRRELRVAEGQVFDSARLSESIERLNGSGLIEPMRREDVEVQVDTAAGKADIVLRLREKPARAVYGTGGTGGAAGGYLGILYTAFNLLGLGEKLTLELDGGASQSNVLLDLAGRHFLGTPFSFGLSLFRRLSGVNVAGIVPDAADLVSIFRERRTGLQLTGSYSLTRKLRAGASLLAEYRSVENGGTSKAQAAGHGRVGSELGSTILLDSTSGAGSEIKGFRLLLGNSISHGGFLGSPETAAGWVSFTGYLDDSTSRRRSSFAFALNLSGIRPLGGRQLDSDRREYLGGEVLRGFPRGGLSSWALRPEAGSWALKPVGSDTLAAVSCEYRVPINGPLSGAAFFDLGWTGLDRANEAPEEDAQHLLEATSGLVRASMGGEVRVDLPLIRQPGRLIFAWNPLRLDRLVSVGGSAQRLADPRGMVRFALGGVY